MDNKVKKILETIVASIDDKKGRNIVALDVKGISSLTDYIVVAEGNVDRHVIALAKAVEEGLDDLKEYPLYREGMLNGDWVVLNYATVMVHLFMPGLREKYQIEKLWKDAKMVDLSHIVSLKNAFESDESFEKPAAVKKGVKSSRSLTS